MAGKLAAIKQSFVYVRSAQLKDKCISFNSDLLAWLRLGGGRFRRCFPNGLHNLSGRLRDFLCRCLWLPVGCLARSEAGGYARAYAAWRHALASFIRQAAAGQGRAPQTGVDSAAEVALRNNAFVGS